jgi:prepilin-type N-terminal cleavage/methylation domain-containing protein
MNHRSRAFTLIELLVVVAIIALLIGLLLPALAKAQKNARTVKDSTQVSQVHKTFLIYANDHGGRLPLPGLINRLPSPFHQNQNVPGQGPEDFTKNNSRSLYSSLIAQEFFNTDIVIGPTEVNPTVQEYRNYNFDSYNPSGDMYWDLNFNAHIANGPCHTSYAHMAMVGERKKTKWRNTQAATDPVLSTRGTRAGEFSANSNEYKLSPTIQLHGPNKEWYGNVCFNDNHVEYINHFFPSGYEPINGTEQLKDNMFKAEFTDYGTQQSSADAFTVLCNVSGPTFCLALYDKLLN